MDVASLESVEEGYLIRRILVATHTLIETFLVIVEHVSNIECPLSIIKNPLASNSTSDDMKGGCYRDV